MINEPLIWWVIDRVGGWLVVIMAMLTFAWVVVAISLSQWGRDDR